MSELAVRTTGLTKYFGGAAAVDHLTLSVPRGCIYGLLGRNGAGKTTAIKLMLGLLHPTAGSSELLGCDSRRLTPEVRGRIGYVTEGHRLPRWMTIAALARFQRAFFPARWDEGLFGEMLDYFRLSAGRKVRRLSNGQRAQVSLAVAMAPDPDLLIMDDPTLGLDVVIRRQFLEGMIQLIQRRGKTILFSSHILGDVERVADRIAIIERGALRADCSLNEFRSAVRKVRLAVPDGMPDEVDIPGLLHSRRGESELELTLVGVSDGQVEAWADQVGAARCKPVSMTLEDQFIEFTSPGDGRLFEWEGE